MSESGVGVAMMTMGVGPGGGVAIGSAGVLRRRQPANSKIIVVRNRFRLNMTIYCSHLVVFRQGLSTIKCMKTKRMFIAITLPAAARAELGHVAALLARQVPGRSVRWVKPDLIHLTLRFLGDTAVSQLPLITHALDQAAAKHAPFSLRLNALGCFPNRKRPRVIWVGLDGEMAPARALKRGIDEVLQPMGWARENRPFRAHLTLGRVKDGRKLRGIEWESVVEKVLVPVTAVHLIESQLRSGGPVYTVRHTSDLGR